MAKTRIEKKQLKADKRAFQADIKRQLAALKSRYLAQIKTIAGGRSFLHFSKEQRRAYFEARRIYYVQRGDIKGRSALGTLVKMQIKDRFDFAWKKNTTGAKVRRIINPILRFTAVFAISYLAFYYCSLNPAISVTRVLPIRLIFGIFLLILLLEIVTDTTELTKTFYFSPDNAVLITYPVKPAKVFFSKLVVFYLYELVRTYLFTVPIFAAFMFVDVYPAYAFFWMIFIFLWVPLVPITIGVLLSLPSFYVARFAMKHSWFKYVGLILLLAGVYALGIWLGRSVPTGLTIVELLSSFSWTLQTFLSWLSQVFKPLFQVTVMIVFGGTNYGLNLLVALITFTGVGAVLTGVYYLAQALFFRMIGGNGVGQEKVLIKSKKTKVHSWWVSTIHIGFVSIFDGGDATYSVVGTSALLPLVIYLLNSFFRAMSLTSYGRYMSFAANFVMILLPVLATNSFAASAFSKQGRAGYLIRTYPVKPLPLLLLRLIPVLGFAFLTLAVNSFVFYWFNPSVGIWQVIVLFVSLFFLEAGHLLISALLDILHPQNEAYATEGTVLDNPNELKSLLIAFAVVIVGALFYFLVVRQNPVDAYFRVLFLAVLFFSLSLLMFAKNVKAYFLEAVK